MKTIILFLFVALNLNAQENDQPYLNTGPSFTTVSRMYKAHVRDGGSDRALENLKFNLYAYHELAKISDPRQKANTYDYLQINYYHDLCVAAQKANKKNKIDQYPQDCDTFVRRRSEYADKYYARKTIKKTFKKKDYDESDYKKLLLKYNIKNKDTKSFSIDVPDKDQIVTVKYDDDKRSKNVPSISVYFDSSTYKIGKTTYSIETGKVTTARPKKEKAPAVQDTTAVEEPTAPVSVESATPAQTNQ